MWTCPGHNGGVFYSRSPIDRIFLEHLGEAIFRDDLDNSVLDERSANIFPGFEAESQGLYREVDELGVIRFYTYVVRE